MKKIKIKTGGLQKKTALLVLIVLLATAVIFSIATSRQNRKLESVVSETRAEQQKAISQTSKLTMRRVLTDTMLRTTVLQASIANNDFSEVLKNVLVLKTIAEGLFFNRDRLEQKEVFPPDAQLDGTVTAMVLCEEGVDYTESEYLRTAAHLSDVMIAFCTNSEKIDGLYIGLADGTDLCVDNKSALKLDADGEPIPFPVRQRPWYKGAAETGGVYFTGIMEDAFSKRPLVTCSAPVYYYGELVGVIGVDIILESMDGFVRSAFEYGGTVFVVNKNGQVIRSSETEGMFAASLEDDALDLRTAGSDELADFINRALAAETGLEEIRIDGKEYFIAGAPMPTVDWAVVSVVEKEITERTEKTMLADFDRINGEANDKYQADSAHIRRIGWLIISVLLIISVVVALFAAGRIVKPLNDMTKDVIECADTGNLFEMKDRYKTRDEIEVLAESFDDLSAKTKQYIDDITRITKEKERVNTELNMASRIQTSMLPHDFPPFPDRSEFGIYASMKPAKEVGGDFYDFFLIDEDHLCMVIADVSGKGVPAALFMMVSKAIIKSNAKTGKSPAGILAAANDTICGNNQMQMFVTVWLGILEISTGKLTAANAGHEYPALMKNGRFELFKDKHGFVIGGMDGVKYKDYEVFLDKGDKLFVYTDGVPEATDAGNDMFGVERMLAALNEAPGSSPEVLLENVRKAVDGFVNGATQFDDLTMLCVEYDGSGCDRGGEAAEA